MRGEELALGSASEHTAGGQDVVGARNYAASHAVLSAAGTGLASAEVVAGVGVSTSVGTEDSVGADDVAVVGLVVVDVPCKGRGSQGEGNGGDSDELHGDGLKVKLRVQVFCRDELVVRRLVGFRCCCLETECWELSSYL